MAEEITLHPTKTPLRSRASSRNSFDFHLSIDDFVSEPNTPSSGAQSPVRGRSLHRVPAHSRLVSRAVTRRHTGLVPANPDWRQRLLSQDFTDTPAEYDDSLIEPLPFDRFRSSLSEEPHRAATFDRSIDLTKFGGHRDTFAVLGFRELQRHRVGLPDLFFSQIVQYLDFDTYKAVRLFCRSWSASITTARPITFPPVSMLPAEILEKIYVELSPVDFNAARHTCRSWMIAGLEERLLTLMLSRGGWLGAMKADKALREQSQEQRNAERRESVVNDDWFLSKRLDTECSLRPGWTGNSIGTTRPPITGLKLTSEIDFTELGEGPASLAEDQFRAIPQFTVSACTKFLLAFEECTIYIYALRGFPGDANNQPYSGHLKLLTSVICPDRVLAVSMDTSSQRYAVAALLHGSVGLVCDVDLIGFSSPKLPSISMRSRSGRYDDGQGSVFIPPLSDERIIREPTIYTEATFGTVFTAPSDRTQTRAIAQATLPEIHGALRNPRLWTLGNGLDPPLPVQTAFYAYSSSGVGAENGPCAIYRNLCSVNDPPISVAICPQRRCVAFGCRAGIELHWVDALTGQDLNRWFPLAAPSDILYFMPAREGIDSLKKLRIISSTRHPAIGDHADEDTPVQEDNRSLNDFVDETYTNLRSRNAPDHYRAVPLSDGYYVLFTQPKGGELCLGREGLPGAGWRQLMSRFVFAGPKDSADQNIAPHIYAVAAEIRWGVRIAVAFEDRLWLFVIPPDVFSETKSAYEKVEAHEMQVHESAPVRIEGVQIATMADIISLALDASAGDLTIWAFTSNGKASVFQLAGSGSKAVTQRATLSNGIIELVRDADGDTVMQDATHNNSTSQVVHFDGTTSHRPHSSFSILSSPYHLAARLCNEVNSPDDYIRGPDTSTPPSYSTTPPFPPWTTKDLPPREKLDEGYASAGDEEFEVAGGRFAI